MYPNSSQKGQLIESLCYYFRFYVDSKVTLLSDSLLGKNKHGVLQINYNFQPTIINSDGQRTSVAVFGENSLVAGQAVRPLRLLVHDVPLTSQL